MKVIIIGCGRMGSGLTKKLLQEAHEVTLIDIEKEACVEYQNIDNLNIIKGSGIEKEIIERAGVDCCDALVSCTNSDETNALVARISKNIYKVPTVIARLFDPNKAKIYNTLGIQTISTTDWGIQQASELIAHQQLDSVFSIGNSDIEIIKVEVPILLAGRSIDELSLVGESRIISITRDNETFIPTNGSVLQAKDILHASVLSASLKRFKSLLGLD